MGARRLLTINTGSSSLKAALYRLREDTTEPPEICAEALRRAGKTSGSRPEDRAPTLISECQAAIARAIAYSREHFEDPPEVGEWTCTL